MAKLRAHPSRVATRDTRAIRPATKTADPFYLSPSWRALMAALIKARGRRCQTPTCRRTHDAEGKPIRVFGDHVVELRDGGAPLDPDNVRLLCGACHTTKTAASRAARASRVW